MTAVAPISGTPSKPTMLKVGERGTAGGPSTGTSCPAMNAAIDMGKVATDGVPRYHMERPR